MFNEIQRAIELAHAGQRDQALYLLREVIRLDPTEGIAWKWLAYLSPDPNEALTAAYRVMDLMPGDSWARESLPTLQARARQSPLAAPQRIRQVPTAQPRPAPQVRPAPHIGLLPALALLITVVACAGSAVMAALVFDQIQNRDPVQIVMTNPPYVGASTEAAPPPVSGEESGQAADSAALIAPSDQPPATAFPQTQAGASGQSALGFVPDVEVTNHITNYSFTASTEDEIRYQLYNNGPRLDDAGMSAIAMASYRIWAEWSAYQTGTCDVNDATVYLDIEYTYPDWQAPSDAPAYLTAEWLAFIEHVTDHEQQHGAIAQECAHEVARQMAQAGTFATCNEMGDTFDVVIQQVYELCDAQQAAFDQVEGHTTFPLP
jgi:predicted secreted Zn-dependent protease